MRLSLITKLRDQFNVVFYNDLIDAALTTKAVVFDSTRHNIVVFGYNH